VVAEYCDPDIIDGKTPKAIFEMHCKTEFEDERPRNTQPLHHTFSFIFAPFHFHHQYNDVGLNKNSTSSRNSCRV
jgi:hypothetical protein